MRIFTFQLGCFLTLILAPVAATSATLRVPSDYPTIQYAINAGSNGDSVQVSPGIYNESVNFAGKGIYLASVAGPAVTMIEPPSELPAVYFDNGESSNAVISGFTLTNAVTGISIASSSPTVLSNVIVNCDTGIGVSSGSPVIENNLIVGCAYGGYLTGVGVAVIQSNLIQSNNVAGIAMSGGVGTILIADNLIQDNQGDAIDGYYDYYDAYGTFNANIIQNVIANNSGYGLQFWIPSGSRGPVAVNNTVVNNGAGGIALTGDVGAVEVINNIILGSNSVDINSGYDGILFSVSPLFQNNDFYALDGTVYSGTSTNLTGGDGNLSANPFLACVPGGDYQLLPGSPCIGAGNKSAPYLPGTDFDGNPRISADTNGSARVDLGAFAFSASSPATPCIYLNVPAGLVAVTVPGQFSVAVNYPVIDATPGATVTCVPPSGSVFPAGTSPVVCTSVYATNVLTDTFTVAVEVPPSITNGPSLINVPAGSNALLSVGAFSTQPLSYQWSFDGSSLAGATNSVLVISNAQAGNEGFYQVDLSNSLGATNSPLIILRILPEAPEIIAQPVSLKLLAGATAVLSGSAAGSQPLSVQWYQDGTALYGATSPQLVISNAQSADAGLYQLAASNYLGSTFSTGAVLTVLPARPWFILQPASAGVNLGGEVEISCLTGGSDDATNPVSYAWYFQGSPLSGQTDNPLWLYSATTNNQGAYFVVAANAYGQATSEVAELSVYLPPAVTAGLTNEVTNEGDTVVLAASATGTPPLAYNWSFNSLPLTNQTATLTLSNATPAQSGFYAVTVSSPYGSTSSTGRLSVFLPACQVVAWGDNSGGQTEVPTNLLDAVAVAGGDYYSLALHQDGTITSWGAEEMDAPSNSLDYVAVAAGADHALGILEDGSMAAWGQDAAGQTDVPYPAFNVLSVAAGDAHSLALLASGQVLAWGDNTHGQLNLPLVLQTTGYWTNYNSPWNNYWVTIYPIPARAIAARGDHSLALMTNGTVAAWGDNTFGESRPPVNLSNAVAIAAGYLHSVALCADGTVTVWGDDTFGQTNIPPGLSNVVAIAAGDFHTLALRSNGRVVGWGNDSYGEAVASAGLPGAAGIACGYYHDLALVPASKLQGHLAAGQMVLDWGAGILQWAPTPAGPYADLPSPGGTYTNLDWPSAPERYFRVKY
jgi:hypothetical protein